MADESVGSNTTRRGTNMVVRQGQTNGRYYGNDTNTKFEKITDTPRDLKP